MMLLICRFRFCPADFDEEVEDGEQLLLLKIDDLDVSFVKVTNFSTASSSLFLAID
jgi:hypothetical protein